MSGAGELEVVDPGLASTVQDLGRPGWLRVGVPQGGALDKESLRLANALVGGGPAQSALEIRYLGPTLRARGGPVRLALVGAEAAMRLEREGEAAQIIEAWRSVVLQPGDLLRVGALKGASTAVLAMAGGVGAPPVLGSRATFLRGGFGGVEGRALRAGDRIAPADPAGARAAAAGPDLWIPPGRRPGAAALGPGGSKPVRVILGPQQDHFPDEELERFLSENWTVSRESDRMGLRLEGPRLSHRSEEGKGFNIVSDGISEGAIQVPGTGQPILLLADRGTAGGYPKIAVAASVDLPILGRASPGDRLRFAAVSVEDAQAALRRREAEVQAALASVETRREPGAVDEAKLWGGNLITAQAPIDPND